LRADGVGLACVFLESLVLQVAWHGFGKSPLEPLQESRIAYEHFPVSGVNTANEDIASWRHVVAPRLNDVQGNLTREQVKMVPITIEAIAKTLQETAIEQLNVGNLGSRYVMLLHQEMFVLAIKTPDRLIAERLPLTGAEKQEFTVRDAVPLRYFRNQAVDNVSDAVSRMDGEAVLEKPHSLHGVIMPQKA